MTSVNTMTLGIKLNLSVSNLLHEKFIEVNRVERLINVASINELNFNNSAFLQTFCFSWMALYFITHN